MKSPKYRLPFSVCWLILLTLLPLVPSTANAESPEKPGGQPPATTSAPNSEKEQAAMMGSMMGSMMEANLKAYISLLGKPEVAEKLASFTKNYYDALVAKGFTKEEALRIVTAATPVNVSGQK